VTDFHRNVMLPLEESGCPIEDPQPRLPDLERAPDPVLAAQGWQRRFMADSARLSEYVELYESLGLEVRAEPIREAEVGPECEPCRLVLCPKFVTLYTRTPARARSGNE